MSVQEVITSIKPSKDALKGAINELNNPKLDGVQAGSGIILDWTDPQNPFILVDASGNFSASANPVIIGLEAGAVGSGSVVIGNEASDSNSGTNNTAIGYRAATALLAINNINLRFIVRPRIRRELARMVQEQ